MSTVSQRLIRRLELSRGDLNDAIARLCDDDLDWSPSPNMRTAGGQLLEIAATEFQNICLLRGDEMPPFDDVESDLSRDTVAGYRQMLNELRQQLIGEITRRSEDELHAEITYPAKWWEALEMGTVPVYEVFSSLAAHEWYHTGQLVSYLWSRGDSPYKWPSE